MNNANIEEVTQFKLLGVTLTNKLKWDVPVQNICSKASQRLTLLKRAGVPANDIVKVYSTITRPILEYAAEIWHPGLTKQQSQILEHIRKRALAIAFNDLNYEEAIVTSGLETLQIRRNNICKRFFNEIQCPDHKLYQYLPALRPHLNLRIQRKFEPPITRTK